MTKNNIRFVRAMFLFSAGFVAQGAESAYAANSIHCYSIINSPAVNQCVQGADKKWNCQHAYTVDGYTKVNNFPNCECPDPGKLVAIEIPEKRFNGYDDYGSCRSACNDAVSLSKPGLVTVIECPAVAPKDPLKMPAPAPLPGSIEADLAAYSDLTSALDTSSKPATVGTSVAVGTAITAGATAAAAAPFAGR